MGHAGGGVVLVDYQPFLCLACMSELRRLARCEPRRMLTKTASSCGSEIYCACSSIIHKETQKIRSEFNKAF